MTTALTEAEITEGMAKLRGWQRDEGRLMKLFQFESYLAGTAFAAAVGVIAEGLNHHPEMTIGWRRVSVSFTTHDAGNQLTAKDFAAAAAIDALDYPTA